MGKTADTITFTLRSIAAHGFFAQS
jgi:hypothetical protein